MASNSAADRLAFMAQLQEDIAAWQTAATWAETDSYWRSITRVSFSPPLSATSWPLQLCPHL
eukprot:11224410-Lingulodinium_polyedra.AAC.1